MIGWNHHHWVGCPGLSSRDPTTVDLLDVLSRFRSSTLSITLVLDRMYGLGTLCVK